MTEPRTTKTIIPRDYGATIRTGSELLFTSPMRYIAGTQLIENDQAFSGATRVENRIQAFFASRRKGVKDHKVRFFLTQTQHGPAYTSHSCPCPDSDEKKSKSRAVLCAHLAGLELALAADNASRTSAQDNRTGLLPAERGPIVPLLYTLDDALVDDFAAQYAAGKKGMFTLSRELLGMSSVYSDRLLTLLKAGSAQLGVLREKEKTYDVASMPPSEDRFYGAVRAVEARMRTMLEGKGFRFNGYSLAFPGSREETVAKRYKQGPDVFEIVTRTRRAPLLVHKKLGVFATNWIDSTDKLSKDLKWREPYVGIDDATRREARITVIVPRTHTDILGSDTNIYVPNVLMTEYFLPKR